MITLREILDNLTYGELAHVAIGNAALGTIIDKDYPRVVSCLNGALTAVHKRFLLRTGEVSLQQETGRSTYYLRTEHTVSAGSPLLTKYVIDSVDDPFVGNIFKIEKVFASDGSELIINDSLQEYPIYTPNFDTLVMEFLLPDLVKVTYRADHPRIKVVTGFDPEQVQLHIPTSILDAISLNVAARIYSPLTAGDGERSAASAFNYAYELECKRLENEGMSLDVDSADNRFEDRGWV